MKPYSFQEYELITYPNNKSRFYKIILSMIIIGIIYIICNYKFNIYEKAILFKEDNSYYLLVDISNNFNKENNPTLKIDNDEYNYDILDNIKFVNNDGNIYKSIPIILDTNKKLDEYIQINYLIKSNTLINIIFELLRGE